MSTAGGKVLDKYQTIMTQIGKWASFYRENPNRFIKEYFGIKLKRFQEILIVEMFSAEHVFFLGCRGISKTWTTALFAITKCVLYPGTFCIVASATRRQGRELIAKIQKIFIPNYPMVALEIEDIKDNQANTIVTFRNGSTIEVVTASQNARCGRATMMIIDEARLVDKNIIDSVLKKFMTASRYPGYLDTEKYADYPRERNQEMYLTSGWYASHWCNTLFRDYAASMILGRQGYYAAALPYQLSIKEKLLDRNDVEDEMSSTDFNEVSFIMEMCAEFWEGADGALYSYDDIVPSRKIKYAFYPLSYSDIITDKRIKIPQRLPNEIRVLSADIALMQSNGKTQNNDATSVFLNQMLMSDNGGRSVKNIVYTQNFEGLRVEEQALEIRRLVSDFDVDYLVIDARGIGLPTLDLIMADMYDPERGITYGALSCKNNEDIAARCKVKNAPKKIWAMLANPDINSQCALTLREELKQGNIKLLNSEEDFEDDYAQISGFSKLDLKDKLRLKLPFINTTLLINELVNLESEVKGNFVKMKEKPGARKDRYSSLSYNIWLSNILEKEYQNQRSKKTFTEEVQLQFRSPVIRKQR